MRFCGYNLHEFNRVLISFFMGGFKREVEEKGMKGSIELTTRICIHENYEQRLLFTEESGRRKMPEIFERKTEWRKRESAKKNGLAC